MHNIDGLVFIWIYFVLIFVVFEKDAVGAFYAKDERGQIVSIDLYQINLKFCIRC